jgi:hypothetical protein
MAGSLQYETPSHLCRGPDYRRRNNRSSRGRWFLVVAWLRRMEFLLMIAKLLTAIGGNWILYAIIAALVVASYGYTYHLGDNAGWDRGEAKYQKREVEIAEAFNAEVSRQAQKNAMAKALEAKRLDDLEKAKAALEKLIKEKSDEADTDPLRDRPALSSDSGLRVDSIH